MGRLTNEEPDVLLLAMAMVLRDYSDFCQDIQSRALAGASDNADLEGILLAAEEALAEIDNAPLEAAVEAEPQAYWGECMIDHG